jgi:hypothetical protein
LEEENERWAARGCWVYFFFYHALFAKELCDVLSKLKAAIPGCERAIACLLTGSTIKNKGKKAGDCPQTGTKKEKSLVCKGKRSDATGKAPAAA